MNARAPKGVRSLSWAEASARRLERQGLTVPSPDAGPADAVAAMCGAHAQVLSAAELSVGLRLTGLTRCDIRASLWSELSLVKTFGPRGTVHLLPTRDLPMWSGALSAVPQPRSPFKDDVQMTAEQTEEVLAAISHAMVDDELTVDELTRAVVGRTGSWAGDLVMPAFQGMWPRQAGNFPVLLVDGTVPGVWHQKRSGKNITIKVEGAGHAPCRAR